MTDECNICKQRRRLDALMWGTVVCQAFGAMVLMCCGAWPSDIFRIVAALYFAAMVNITGWTMFESNRRGSILQHKLVAMQIVNRALYAEMTDEQIKRAKASSLGDESGSKVTS